MFKIFYDTLVRPKQIVKHVDGSSKWKFFGFICLLILLLVIPSFVNQISAYSFSNQEAHNIVEYILDEEPLEYEIKDGKLLYTGDGDADFRYVKIEKDEILMAVIPVYLVFSLDSNEIIENKLDEVVEEDSYIAVFQESEIRLLFWPGKKTSNDNNVNNDRVELAGLLDTLPTEKEELKKLSYDNISSNLNYEKVYEKYYYLEVYKVGSLIYENVKWDLILETAFLSILLNVVSFFLTLIFDVILMGFIFRFMGLKFKTVLKIATLCSTTYVVGSVIGYLFGLSFVAYICELIPFIYTYNVMKQYTIIQMMSKRGGN